MTYALEQLRAEAAALLKKATGLDVSAESLSRPPRPELGDLAWPAYEYAKATGQKPAEAASKAAASIKPSGLVAEARAVGPYVNFPINWEKFNGLVLKEAVGKKYGSSDLGKGKTIVIDYSSPNIAKPMHVGHLRSTIIGQAIRNCLEFQGFKCVGINHLGDWGHQFGRLLAAYEKWGDDAQLEKDPINYLVDLYVRWHKEEDEQKEETAKKWFKALEAGDEKATRLWKKFRELSIKKFEQVYDLLGAKFDEYRGEAYYSLLGRTTQIVKEALDKKVAEEEKEGTVVVPLQKHGLINTRLLEDGRTLYVTRDIATAEDRYERFKFYKNLYVVASQQNLYFQQLFKTLELLGYPWAKDCVHVNFGIMSMPGGKKISTRTGEFIEADEVLKTIFKEAEKTIEEKNPTLKDKAKTAQIVGVAALVFADLSQNRVKDIEFDLKKILSFEGDTGPYLQYAHVRCCGILEKLGETKSKPEHALLTEDEEKALVLKVAGFPEIIKQTTATYEPHILAQYLLELTHAFSAFYDNCPVIQEKQGELKASRAELVKATKNTLKTGLNLLGIQAPEKM